MAKLDQENNRKGLIDIGEKMGLNKSSTNFSPRPAQLGVEIPDIATLGYQNYKANTEMSGTGFLDKLRNKMARSKKGGSKDETF